LSDRLKAELVAEKVDVALFVFPVMCEVIGIKAKIMQARASYYRFSKSIQLLEDLSIGFELAVDSMVVFVFGSTQGVGVG
jgi:hypothetical protein